MRINDRLALGNMTTDDSQSTSGKGRPTPKRKDVESARKQGLSAPRGSKEARQAAKQRAREARSQARAGLLAGDSRYFPARDAGPVKAHVRDFIDSRRTVGEVFVVVAFLVLALGLVNNAQLQSVVVFAWSAVLLLVIIDTTIVGFLLSRSLKKLFPAKSERRGAVSYGVLRALQLRKFRIPPPRLAPGGKPVKTKNK
jgi:hypothetical protein